MVMVTDMGRDSRRLGLLTIGALALCAILYSLTSAQATRRASLKRAQRPDWNDQASRGIFFDDAFIEALVGERPANFDPDVTRPTGPTSPDNGEPGGSAGGGYGWEKIISATTLEDEIKALKLEVDKDVTTPGKYASGDYKQGRRHFSMLALLFAIIAEHDADVRWKKESLVARDLFARAGFNSKVGAIQAYNEAKARKTDLGELIRGGGLQGQPGDSQTQWDTVCDRVPLMQRLEQSHQEGLVIWTANAGEFSNRSEQILHQAELVATIATVIKQEGFEFWDDDDYVGYCDELQRGALNIVDAVKLNNYDAARQAAGEISKACAACHEGYRS